MGGSGGTRASTAGRLVRGAVLLAVAGLLVGASLAPAGAQVELTRGSAAATATVAGINIPYGGANISIDAGVANASYFEGTAKASAILLEPNALRITNVIKSCDADFALPLPEATTADTNAAGGKATTAHKEAGPGVGVEDAAAEPGSKGRSTVTGAGFGIPGVVEVSGGTALTSTALDQPGQARTMRAEVRTDALSLLGGLIELEGLRWVVQQQANGADDRSIQGKDDTTFSVGAIRIGGVPLPTATPADLATAFASINAITGASGLNLRMPKVIPNGAQGLEYTPLQIAIGGETAAAFLYPLIAGGGGTSLVDLFNSLTQPLIFEPSTCNSLLGVFKASPEANQLLNTLGVYAPIILSAFAASLNGGAELDLNVGGARTVYDATWFPPRSIPTIDRSPTPTAAAVDPIPGSVTPGRPPTALGGAARVSTSCRSTSPVGRPGCWKGRGPLAATAAAVVTLGLFATDEAVRRRRQARATQETP